MNQKKARALRREAKFLVEQKNNISNDDKYRDHVVDIEIDVPIIDIKSGKAKFLGFKKGQSQEKITECVYGPFKEYKMLKKLYYNPNYDAKLIVLPSKEEENNIANEMLAQHKERQHAESNTIELNNSNEEELHTCSKGGLQSENGGADIETNKSE